MLNLNKVLLIGRITQDIELKSTPNGQSTTTINVATNRSWKDAKGQKKEQSEFSRVVIWGKQAELVAQYLTKGSEIMIEGHLQTRKWTGKDGANHYVTEIVAEKTQFGAKPTGYTAPAKPKKVEEEEELPDIIDVDMHSPEDDIDVKDIPF